MSLHPSFGKNSKIKQKRSVLKRYERIDILKKKEKWNEKDSSIFHLPKTKSEE